jgi:hypothetical protein
MSETDKPMASRPSERPTAGQPAASELSARPPEGPPANLRKETELERYDRNLTELMGELRVALPGVQVLFGFLLVIPFDSRFKAASGAERGLYFATLALTLLTSMLLIAPTMVHRLTFRRGEKAYIVSAGNRLAIAGLSTLAIALTCAIAFVTDFVFGSSAAIATGLFAAFAFGVLWYLLPLGRRRGRL